MRALLITLALLLAANAPMEKAWAVDPREKLADSALEARARAISAELRCVVCQNQSIDESDADLAKDLRTIIRQRIVAGDTDQDVIDFVVARYGEFVLLRPPFKGATVILWLGPLIFAFCGLAGIVMYYRRRPN
jgi:cytochrome c-type biogenesis protein CcmH